MGWSVLFSIPAGEIVLALNLAVFSGKFELVVSLVDLGYDDTRDAIDTFHRKSVVFIFIRWFVPHHLAFIQSGNTTA
jgi:hypothetical protein